MEKCIISSDVLIEILARLPVWSLMRFKCVCKFFYSLIKSDDQFKHKHFEISRARRDYVVFEHYTFSWGEDVDRRFGLVYKEWDCDEIGYTNLTFPTSPISYIRYADGMFCLVTRIQMSVDNYSWDISVWNSATREIKKLQNLEALDGFDPNCTAIGFGGYGFSSNMIGKVVMIWVTPDPIVMVYSQDRNNSCGWKRSGHSLGNFYVNNTGSNLYLKGKYYWICIVQGQNYKEQSHLLWFDFDDETFGKIELPKLDPLAAISAMKDTIALISYCIDGNHIEVWIMNEHNNVITWNHYASVEGNEYSHPMRIWNLGSHLLVFHQLLLGTNDIRELKHFISYDLITKEKKVIYTASWNFYMYPPFVYSESLLSF